MKMYVGFFSEIKARSSAEQMKILEKARFYSFTTLKLNGRSVLYGCLCSLLAFFPPVAIKLYYSFGPIVSVLVGGVSLYLSIMLFEILQETFIRKGLVAVLGQG